MIRKFIITAVAATVIAASAAPAMAGGIYIDQTGFGNQVGGSQSGWNNTFGTKQTGWWNKAASLAGPDFRWDLNPLISTIAFARIGAPLS
ncbi:hypothetical protein [Devosia sp.]|uniref:hypothetical protein n=1 Tax=Devosia sp. TaxID=1871048 RepID=UPI001AC48677|nr:hypothetical protein [Devosia sp.]MBN9333799.1 hypothetical protein [Devosia sp.]